MIHLSTQDLLRIAEAAVDGDVLVRDIGLLESAAARPQTTVFGEDAYPTLCSKAAALLDSIVNNHALVDGNRRLGLAALLVFLRLNGRSLTLTNDHAYDLVIAVAEGRGREIDELARQIEQGSRPLQP